MPLGIRGVGNSRKALGLLQLHPRGRQQHEVEAQTEAVNRGKGGRRSSFQSRPRWRRTRSAPIESIPGRTQSNCIALAPPVDPKPPSPRRSDDISSLTIRYFGRTMRVKTS